MSLVRITHRCARGDRCINRVRVDHDPGCECRCHGQSALDAECDVEGGCGSVQDPTAPPKFEGGAIITPTGLCEACAMRVLRSLEELPLDYTELNLLLASGESGITSDVIMGSKELQVPIRVSIEALQASMVHETRAWAIPLAEKLGIGPRRCAGVVGELRCSELEARRGSDWSRPESPRQRPGRMLERSVRMLTGALDTFLSLPRQTYRHHSRGTWIERDGIEGALELMRMHELVRFAAGKTKLIHQLPTPCPRCEHMSLARHNGTDHVVCENCGVRWPEDQYKRLTLVLAEDYRDIEIERTRKRLASCEQGSVGSARGGYEPPWLRMPMVDFPEGASA